MYSKPMLLNEKLQSQVHSDFEASYKTTEMFGLEVELEGKGGIKNPSYEVNEMWTAHHDGSLRALAPGDECIEYVTRSPQTLDNITKAIKLLTDFLNQDHIKIYDSYRTSIHVHVNCMADTIMHVCNFITLSIMFDELFVSQNGNHRIGNNFCLRSGDAEGQIQELIKSVENHGSIFGFNPQNRYSSVNFASLMKFGTVEFRSLECTTDPLRIVHWVRTINSLKQASRLFQDPQDIIRKFSQISVQEFLYTTLGASASKYVQVPAHELMLFNGMRLAQDFAFCSKWIPRTEEEVKKSRSSRSKAFNQYIQMGGAPGNWGQLDVEAGPGQVVYNQILQAQPPQPAPVAQVDEWGPEPDDDYEEDLIEDDDHDEVEEDFEL